MYTPTSDARVLCPGEGTAGVRNQGAPAPRPKLAGPSSWASRCACAGTCSTRIRWSSGAQSRPSGSAAGCSLKSRCRGGLMASEFCVVSYIHSIGLKCTMVSCRSLRFLPRTGWCGAVRMTSSNHLYHSAFGRLARKIAKTLSLTTHGLPGV